MERGKVICKMLKEIRRRIARENDIEFITSECRHKGSCAGTCPKCEAEVRYLEEQLESRRRLGKVVKVVGLSMGLATIAPALFTACHPRDGDLEILQGDPVPSEDTRTNNEGRLQGDVAPSSDVN